MKIAVGLFYLECNTFNKDLVTRDDFIIAEGEDVLSYLAVGDDLRAAGAEIVPLIMASALPAGILKEEDYFWFEKKILDGLRKEGNVDGIFLHLHGALEVENIGSGELRLLQQIRSVVGNDIPVGIVLDPHANNHPELADYADIIRGYHTIPHCDQGETERFVVKQLLNCIERGIRIKPSIAVIPAIIAGEKGTLATEPLGTLFKKGSDLEKTEGIRSVSIFMGDPWSDCPNSHLSVVVVPDSDDCSKDRRRGLPVSGGRSDCLDSPVPL